MVCSLAAEMASADGSIVFCIGHPQLLAICRKRSISSWPCADENMGEEAVQGVSVPEVYDQGVADGHEVYDHGAADGH